MPAPFQQCCETTFALYSLDSLGFEWHRRLSGILLSLLLLLLLLVPFILNFPLLWGLFEQQSVALHGSLEVEVEGSLTEQALNQSEETRSDGSR